MDWILRQVAKILKKLIWSYIDDMVDDTAGSKNPEKFDYS